MKLKQGVLISQVEDNFVVAVFTGEAGKACNGMLRMNAVSAYLLQQLQSDTDEDRLTASLLERYEGSEVDARKSVRKVISELEKAGLLV